MSPEPFEVIELTRLLREDVRDEVAVVQQNPFAVRLALDAQRPDAAFLEGLHDALGDGLVLTGGLPRAEKEMIGEGTYRTDVEDKEIFRFLPPGCLNCGFPVLHLSTHYGRLRLSRCGALQGLVPSRFYNEGVRLLAVAFFLGISAAVAPAAEPTASTAELDRVKALVDAGALPRRALDAARKDEELSRLQQSVRRELTKADLTPRQADMVVREATRFRDLTRERFLEAKNRADQGALPANELPPYTEQLEFAERQLELAESRARLVRQLADMATAESRFDELEDEELAFGSFGGLSLTPEDLFTLEAIFLQEFGTPLPISAEGPTAVHEAFGFDHSERYDVALHPDDPQGQFVLAVLNSWGVPFIAFRSAVPGQATGPHIHIGPRSDPLPLD